MRLASLVYRKEMVLELMVLESSLVAFAGKDLRLVQNSAGIAVFRTGKHLKLVHLVAQTDWLVAYSG
jgi:hypothetical protein